MGTEPRILIQLKSTKMKYLKSILAIIILTVAFGACEKEEISYAFQEISAPSDVKAVFDITQDDTGLVTVTPSGEGAQEFQVYWGDVANEEPELVTPGGSLEHIFAEGEYKVRVIAVGSTGLTSEFTQMINVSFSAPENLEVNIDQSDPNPLLVKISATADNATLFEVFFGDTDDEEATPLMPGETLEHLYPAPGDYTVRVIAKGASATTVEFTEVITVSEASGAMELPITFDDPSVNYAFGTFNGSSFEVLDNPDQSGANEAETKVGAITNSGAAWEGVSVPLGTPVDMSGENKTLTMKLWSDTPVELLFKLEDEVERDCEVVAAHGGTGWEILTFNFATDATKSYIDGNQGVGEPFVPTGTYATLVMFVDGPKETAGTFYIDDIEQEQASGNCEAETEENIDPAAGDINWTFQTNDFAHTFEPFGDIQAEIVPNPDPTGINTSCNVQSYVKTAGCQTWSGVGKGLGNAIDLTAAGANTTFKLMVYGESKTTTVTIQLEFEPFPNVDPLAAINQEMTKVGEWEELTFDFSEHTDKTFKSIIVYFDRDNACDDAVYYFDNLRQVPSDGGGGDPTEPASAAPAPGQNDADVISLFSDSYTDVQVDTWRTDWSSATLEDVTIDGSAMKKYSELNFVGIETVSQTIDASGMSHFRTDVWSADFEEFKIKLVDFGADGMFGGGDDVEHEITIPSPAQGQWVSLDIPLSDFTGLTTRGHIAQLIYSGSPSGNMTVFIDNVYFYNDNPGGGDPTEPESAAPAPEVDEANVISIYSDAYTDLAGTDLYPNWGQQTTFEEVDLAGDKAIKYGNMNYQGIQIGSTVDATNYEFLHIDVWSADYDKVPFFAISVGSGEKSVELEVTRNTWNGFDIPLSAFTDQGLSVNDLHQFKFDVQPGTGGAIYIDNLYFYTTNSGGGSSELKLPISFDEGAVTYEFTTFNGASYDVVDNPDLSGANAVASKVGAITNSGGPWEGGYFVLDVPVDFSGDNKTITLKFWSNVATPILLKFEGGVSGERQCEVVGNHSGGGWESVSFNFATDATKSYIDGNQGVGEPFVPEGKYANLVLFVDGPGNTAGTFYMDDIIQE